MVPKKGKTSKNSSKQDREQIMCSLKQALDSKDYIGDVPKPCDLLMMKIMRGNMCKS